MPRYRTLAGCALAFFLFAAQAFAGPSAKELSKARAKFQQATELEQAGNYTTALEVFRDVGQVKMTPQVRYHIAFCEEKLGRLLAALGGYELAASDAARVDPSFEKEVTARSDELKSRIPKLVITRGKGAEAAQIELDGVVLGSSSVGAPMNVDPGPHEVRAKSGGKKAFSSTVELAEKDQKTVEVVLEDEAGAVDTGPAGPVGGEKKPHDEGTPKKPSKVVPFVIGGVGVASLAASGVFFLMKNSAINELDGACGSNRNQCPPDKKDTYDKAKLYNTLSGVTLGVGVVGVGVAATLLLTQKPSKEKPTTGWQLVPVAPSTNAGMSLFKAF